MYTLYGCYRLSGVYCSCHSGLLSNLAPPISTGAATNRDGERRKRLPTARLHNVNLTDSRRRRLWYYSCLASSADPSPTLRACVSKIQPVVLSWWLCVGPFSGRCWLIHCRVDDTVYRSTYTAITSTTVRHRRKEDIATVGVSCWFLSLRASTRYYSNLILSWNSSSSSSLLPLGRVLHWLTSNRGR